MKRVYLFAITTTLMLLVSGCSMQRKFIKGQAEWSRIQISDNFNYENAFNTVLDMLSDKYEMEMISKDGGYIKTAWNMYVDVDGSIRDAFLVRVYIKFNHDRTQMSIKTDARKVSGNNFISGSFPQLTQEVRDDVSSILGL